MAWHVAKRFLTVLILLPAYSYPSSAKDVAAGRFSPHCDGASFYLSKVPGLPGQTLILNIRQYALSWWQYRPQESWVDAYAERCANREKCEQAVHARIWLNKVGPKDKHASGKYDVDFGREHLNGSFSVKYRYDKGWICE